MKTTISPRFSAVPRARLDRALSGLGALTLLGAARRFDGWTTVGLAAVGGMLVARALAGLRIVREKVETQEPEVSTDPVDIAGEDSFPASDPPSWGSPTSAGRPR
jgi:hypothetical protein